MREPRITTSLYIPVELYQQLETYMLKYHGNTFGKNAVILLALRKFLDDHNTINKINPPAA